MRESNGLTKTNIFNPKMFQDEIITGLLLSDGHLLKVPNKFQNSLFQISQSVKNIAFVDYIEMYLNELGFSTYKKTYVRELGTVVNLNTERHPFFTKLRELWYPEDKKIVPDSVKLTPKSTAYWFMGDGTSNWYKRGNKKANLSIATDGFDTNSVIKLQSELFYRFEINCYLRFRIGNTRPYIEIKKSSEVYKFMTMIKPHMVSCFYYKVKTPSLNTRTGPIPSWKTDKSRKKCSVNSCPRTSIKNRSVCNLHKSRETNKANLINQ